MRIFVLLLLVLAGALAWAIWQGGDLGALRLAGVGDAVPEEIEPLAAELASDEAEEAEVGDAPEPRADLPSPEPSPAPEPPSVEPIPALEEQDSGAPETAPAPEDEDLLPEPLPEEEDLPSESLPDREASLPSEPLPDDGGEAAAQESAPAAAERLPVEPVDPTEALAAIAPDLAAPAAPAAPSPPPVRRLTLSEAVPPVTSEAAEATTPVVPETPDPAPRGRITGDRVNLRDGPGTDNRAVGLLALDEAVDILERQEDWVRIRTGAGLEGWVSAQFVEDAAG